MAFLTDTFITETLGFGGTQKYDAITGTGAAGVATKARYIALADSVVVAAAQKGGYSSVSASSPPAAGDALNMLQQMSFVVWLRFASSISRDVQLPDDLVADWPRPFWLYTAGNDENRTDLPGLTRDALAGPDGARISNGIQISSGTDNTPMFSPGNWPRFP